MLTSVTKVFTVQAHGKAIRIAGYAVPKKPFHKITGSEFFIYLKNLQIANYALSPFFTNFVYNIVTTVNWRQRENFFDLNNYTPGKR